MLVDSRKVCRRQEIQSTGNFKFVHLARWLTMMLQWHQKSKFRQIKAGNLRLIPIMEDEGGTCDYNQPHLPKSKIENGGAWETEANNNQQ
jgi:hypothetical protein